MSRLDVYRPFLVVRLRAGIIKNMSEGMGAFSNLPASKYVPRCLSEVFRDVRRCSEMVIGFDVATFHFAATVFLVPSTFFRRLQSSLASAGLGRSFDPSLRC